uniref:Xanthine permease n=1 Tax=Archaeoglobus fulgidus TaxID=2234 RepID=A0A7J2TGK9_ARCFL
MKGLKYGIDEIPKPNELISLSIHWLIIAAPILIIGGRIVADFQFTEAFEKTLYMQKLFLISGLTILAQILIGHRLPIISGPSAILIAGIYATNGPSAYTSITICGLLLFFFAITGKMRILQSLFSQKIVSIVFLLIIITLLPLIIDLISSEGSAFYNAVFSIIFVSSLFLLAKFLKGFWSTNMLFIALIFGTVIYLSIFPREFKPIEIGYVDFHFSFSFKPEILIPFLFFYLALAINDFSSIYSVGKMLEANGLEERVKKGVLITGISNFFSGLFNVVGTVNYAMSPGIIAITGSASRFSLLPAGIFLILFALFPPLIHFFAMIPKAVIASVFVYILCHQLLFALKFLKIDDFSSAISIFIPLILGSLATFAPSQFFDFFPILKPVFGNGFIVGLLVAVLIERISRERDKFISKTEGHGKEGCG